MKTTAQIRQAFIRYFEQHQHRHVPSSPLVPANDPTLLFTNAGMVQFKDVFLGAEKRNYTRAVSSQRCVRAGGKHNDLDQVGYTARHHTFFEMLGNFSFGDYFKEEAIRFAWEFLTDTLGLPAEKLWVTVYHSDDEAASIWQDKIGLAEERVLHIGDKPGGKAYDSDNFWAMGDTGPCGPCTEIFYDHGDHIEGGLPGTPEEDGDRYIEIWNLVFMQFDRAQDGSMTELPAPCVDTGMGLERLAAVLQGGHSNYDIDLFQALIAKASELTGCGDRQHPSLKVIADHIRSCAFLIVDGVLPSNEGRGYVLRRIIRRAIRHGHKLGCEQAFFADMTGALVAEMGDAYPELQEKQSFVEDILGREEKRFAETLSKGMQLLSEQIGQLSEDEIPGDVVFKLYDTYGFPVDLTADVAREHDLRIDETGFQQCMESQRNRARSEQSFKGTSHVDADVLSRLPASQFTGYGSLTGQGEVIAILRDGKKVTELRVGEEADIVLDSTPFYAESGGQVGDTGQLSSGDTVFDVLDTQKIAGEIIGHRGKLKSGVIQTGAKLEANVTQARRLASVRNHSATHLLHAALRNLLGTHVEQKGSLVAPDRLRFDFSHFEPISQEELDTIEQQVNAAIRSNFPAQDAYMSYDDAISSGAMALFGEKYGDEVRVLRFGDFSVELCGGTHVERTGDIGLFRIVSEGGIAAGVRRIEAITGAAALQYSLQESHSLDALANLVKSSREDGIQRVQQLLEKLKSQEKEIDALRLKLASGGGGQDLASQATMMGDVQVLLAEVEGADAKSLRELCDQMRDKLAPAAVVLATGGDKALLVAGVSKDLTKTINAKDLVQVAAEPTGGRGGGRPDFAQAGGPDAAGIAAGLAAARQWLRDSLE